MYIPPPFELEPEEEVASVKVEIFLHHSNPQLKYTCVTGGLEVKGTEQAVVQSRWSMKSRYTETSRCNCKLSGEWGREDVDLEGQGNLLKLQHLMLKWLVILVFQTL